MEINANKDFQLNKFSDLDLLEIDKNFCHLENHVVLKICDFPKSNSITWLSDALQKQTNK